MNIRILVEQQIGKNKVRQFAIKRANITDPQISKFLNQRAGLDCFALTRLLLAMECKIVDKQGNTLLGQPDLVNQQIKDNIVLPIILDKNGVEIKDGDKINIIVIELGTNRKNQISSTVKYFSDIPCFMFSTDKGWLEFNKNNCELNSIEIQL